MEKGKRGPSPLLTRVGDTLPARFIDLTIAGDRIAAIRDFRYVTYIGQGCEVADG